MIQRNPLFNLDFSRYDYFFSTISEFETTPNVTKTVLTTKRGRPTTRAVITENDDDYSPGKNAADPPFNAKGKHLAKKPVKPPAAVPMPHMPAPPIPTLNMSQINQMRGPRGKYKKSAAQLKKEAKDLAKQHKANLAAAKRAAKNNKGGWPMPIPGMRLPNHPQK